MDDLRDPAAGRSPDARADIGHLGTRFGLEVNEDRVHGIARNGVSQPVEGFRRLGPDRTGGFGFDKRELPPAPGNEEIDLESLPTPRPTAAARQECEGCSAYDISELIL
jgi:hypothetical protein